MKFLQDITLGQYMPGDSFLHRLDPRTILTPLFHSLSQRADDLTMAKLARGYVNGAKRTHLYELKMRGKDYGVLMGILGFVMSEKKMI